MLCRDSTSSRYSFQIHFQPANRIERRHFFLTTSNASLPTCHRDHHRVLIHFEVRRLIKLKTSFPGVAKSVGPLSWMTIFLMPNEFLGPQPALFPHSKNQFKHVGVPLARDDLLFDV